MGWTETNWVKGTKIIDWFKEGYNFENEHVKQTVLDAALVARTEAFAAIEQIKKDTGERTVSMAVVIVKFQNEFYNFRYKDMDETMGPYICRCPKRLMKLLTPTEHEHALEWRKRVEEYWKQKDEAKKKRGKLNVGDTIVFTRPIRFTNGTSYKSLQVHRTKPLTLTDGSRNIFGYTAEYKISRKALDSLIDHVVPKGQGSVDREIEEVNETNIHKYPKYKYHGNDKEYTCILWAQSSNGWEWYGFELDDKENKIYFGYVLGFEKEFGYFSLQELIDNGVKIVTNPEELHELMTPNGSWEKVSA